MFALCGVMIVVGIVYIRNAPTPAPAESAAVVVEAPASELAAAVVPTTLTGADIASGSTKSRSVNLDALAREAAAQTSVPPKTTASTPAVPTSSVTTTTARVTVPVPSTITVTAPPATVASPPTTVAPIAPPTTSQSITLTATPPPAPPGSPTTTVTTIAAPPTTVAAMTTKLYANNDSGIASWFNAPDNTCAHRTLPFGTMVKVTRIRNGAVAFCKVNDRGPTIATGRLIDLSMDTFAKLAAPEAGLIDVTIEW
ncbi:MAG TPA: RlpA-like double-psi beta-barrel domain-containing protein [Acidimicrobiales bacterium]